MHAFRSWELRSSRILCAKKIMHIGSSSFKVIWENLADIFGTPYSHVKVTKQSVHRFTNRIRKIELRLAHLYSRCHNSIRRCFVFRIKITGVGFELFKRRVHCIRKWLPVYYSSRMDYQGIRRCLQLRIHDAISILPPFDCNSTVLRPFNDVTMVGLPVVGCCTAT